MRDHAPGVVAGVDGSDSSVVAARWAFEEARRRCVGLTLVFVWGSRPDGFHPPFDAVATVDLRAHAEQVLADVARQLGPAEGDKARIATVVVEGIPGPALIDEASDAELLVVGSHGPGSLSRAVLGSVSTYCVHHAKCPTVVVPAPVKRSSPRGLAAIP